MVPFSSLRSGLVGVVLAAEAIVASSARIRGTVTLAAGLSPNESVRLGVTRISGRSNTETGAVDVAPVTPLLAETGDGVATGVHDGIVGHAGRLELGAELCHVRLLVLAAVVLGVLGAGELTGALVPRVPASDVGRETADLLRRACILVDRGEALGSGLQVGVPT